MKTYIIALAALAAISSSASAGSLSGTQNRNHDLRDSDTYTGRFSAYQKNSSGYGQGETFALESLDEIVTLRQQREERRLSEKNEGNVSGRNY